jgi:hypothetical protein
MRYIAIIFGVETEPPPGKEELRALFAEYLKFNEEARSAGVFRGAEALQSTDTATVVRAMEHGTAVADGPFADAGQPVLGFYMLECENLDQAIEWAAKIPQARTGAVEVRPALEMDK